MRSRAPTQSSIPPAVASLAAYDPLRPPSAVTTERDGVPVVAHYGSVSAEIAASTKAAGLVDRSGIRQLAIAGAGGSGRPRAGGARPRRRPRPGTRRLRRRYLVLPGHGRQGDGRGRPDGGRPLAPGCRQGDRDRRPRRGARSASPAPPRCRCRPAGRADRGGRGARRRAGRRRGRRRSGGRVARVLARETADHFLLLFEAGHPNEVWQALWDAGHALGLAPVGNEALELLQASHRPFD